jgi:hypothetical protein
VAVARRPSSSLTTAHFDGVKTFSATIASHRAGLGDIVTSWLASHDEIEIVDMVVMQSSDSHFHCLTIIVFFNER